MRKEIWGQLDEKGQQHLCQREWVLVCEGVGQSFSTEGRIDFNNRGAKLSLVQGMRRG